MNNRKIYITGDVHGYPCKRLTSKLFPEGKTLSKDDIVFIAGDFGILFEPWDSNREAYNKQWLENNPWTTISVLGNHENYDKIQVLPVVEKFGAKLYKVSDSIFYVQNGQILTIDGKKFWCMGGAMSTDKGWRIAIERIEKTKCWWEQEIPTKEEMQRGIDLLEENNNIVDYIITHTMPSECVEMYTRMNFGNYQQRTGDPVSRYLSFVMNEIKPTFKSWFCGHFHENHIYKPVQCLYDKIIEVK